MNTMKHHSIVLYIGSGKDHCHQSSSAYITVPSVGEVELDS